MNTTTERDISTLSEHQKGRECSYDVMRDLHAVRSLYASGVGAGEVRIERVINSEGEKCRLDRAVWELEWVVRGRVCRRTVGPSIKPFSHACSCFPGPQAAITP